MVNGVLCGEGTVTRALSGGGLDYVVDVLTDAARPGCGTSGVAVHFRVGTATAREVGVFQPGISALLDLSPSEPDPTPTPPPERRWGAASAPTAAPVATCESAMDAGFGRCGRVTTGFGETTGGGWAALALAADGTIVAAGGGTQLALARYQRDGSLDRAFGDGGRVTAAAGDGASWATAVAIQADGAIVAAGGNAQGIAVARFTGGGALDRQFGANGIVTLTVPSVTAVATALTVQADGRIVIAGQADGVVLARLLGDGTPDPTFGRGGIVLSRVPGMLAGARSLAIQRDGAIVVAGWFGVDTNGVALGTEADGFLLLRYTRAGTPDPTFGDGGRVQTAIGPRASAEGVAVQPDGRIVVAGGNYGVYAVARYLPGGALDSGFGSGGIGRSALGTTREGDGWHALALLPDGTPMPRPSASAAPRSASPTPTATPRPTPAAGVPLPDLTPTLLSAPGRLQAGAVATIRIGLVNLGPGDARGVTVRAALSGGTVVSVASVGLSCTAVGLTVTCAAPALAAASMAMIEVTIAAPSAPGTLVLTVAADPDGSVGEVREENNVASLAVVVE